MPQRIQWTPLSLRKSRWLRSNGLYVARCLSVAKRKNRGCHRGFFSLPFSVTVRGFCGSLSRCGAFLDAVKHHPESVTEG